MNYHNMLDNYYIMLLCRFNKYNGNLIMVNKLLVHSKLLPSSIYAIELQTHYEGTILFSKFLLEGQEVHPSEN